MWNQKKKSKDLKERWEKILEMSNPQEGVIFGTGGFKVDLFYDLVQVQVSGLGES